jgi:DnaJ-class molecular chaperone
MDVDGDADTREVMRCPTCHGSGLLPDVDNTFEPCPMCHEDGVIDRETAHLLGIEFDARA